MSATSAADLARLAGRERERANLLLAHEPACALICVLLSISYELAAERATADEQVATERFRDSWIGDRV